MILRSLLGRIYRRGSIANNTVTGTVWQVIRLVSQLALVLLIARALGPDQYGSFAGLLGLATAMGGLTGLGSGTLLLRDVSRDHANFGRNWWATLRLSLVTGLALCLIFMCLAPVTLRFHVPLSALIAVAAAELLFYPFVYICGFALQAFERTGAASALATIMALFRLSGAMGFVLLFHEHELVDYLYFHFATSLTAACVCAVLAKRMLPFQAAQHKPYTWQEIRTSISFSLSWFTANALGELDKTMSARYAGADITSYYTVAYRMVSTLTTPVSTLLLATQPRLFRMAHTGATKELRRLVPTIAIVTLIYAIACTACLPLLASVLPFLFGARFAPAVHATWLLIPLMFLICMRLMAGSILTALDGQKLRAILEGCAVALLLIASPFLMPGRGLPGVVMTITLTEVALASALAVGVLIAFFRTTATAGSAG